MKKKLKLLIKTQIFGFLTLLILSNYSCTQEKANNSEFEFVIQGEVKDGDGVELALYIPGKGFNNRIKSTITDGKYIFNGRSDVIERGKIYFEEDIIDRETGFWAFPVFIEPIEQKINFTIYGDSLKRWSKDEVIIKPSNSKFSFENLNVARGKNQPSKEKILSIHDSLFKNNNFDAAELYYLTRILNKSSFSDEKLSIKEKETINYLFDRIDTSLSKSFDYKSLKDKLNKINQINPDISFNDYTFANIEGNEIKLSDNIKNHKFTVLYFWINGCKPCRIFNKETTPKTYQLLKENNIELISISTDKSKEIWERYSTIDRISWINLYAGSVSDIILDYDIDSYPTKIILDNEFNIVDFKFNKAKDLLGLIHE